ncbi:MAG: hypothetical protein ACYSTY_04910 [Planctomycetota bacterium]|jgi:hypothetical protein
MRRVFANPRLIIMPVVILAVAAALAVWGSQQRQRTTEQVREMVQQVCYEMAHDGDVTRRLAGTDPMVARPLVSQLRELIDAQALDTLGIDVAAGDVDEIGSAQQPATHIAVIRLAGTERLGLRLLHSGEDELTVIGFWVP